MKLVSLNIELNRHHERVFTFLAKEKPDVICLQEVLEEDFDRYKKTLGLAGVHRLNGYLKAPPYKDLMGKKQGCAIFAKNIINSGFSFYAGSKENVSRPFDQYMSDEHYQKNHALLWADIRDEGGVEFRIATTHLLWTEHGESTPAQLTAVESLIAVCDTLGELVLCGDMNAPRGRETFSRLAGRYKDNIPPEYKTSIDGTLHRDGEIMFMVDGLFTTAKYRASNVRLEGGVSDHMAIVADIERLGE